MGEIENKDQLLETLDRILTVVISNHWHTGKTIKQLRGMLTDAVKAVAAAHRGVTKDDAQKLDSLTAAELDALISSLDLPGKFPNAKLP